MNEFRNKLVQRISNTKFLRDLREFECLIKAIGECKSKLEEDRIISRELEVLKQRLSDPKLDKSRGKEYMVRLIYCEMLGHDASFAYVKALQFASEPNLLTKKAAYLALTQFLDHNHELVLLLVNTLLSDLKSDNFINVCTALVVATKLIGPDLVHAVYPMVVDRLRHPKEHVRKKAVMVLHHFHQLDPKHQGPLSGMEIDQHFRAALCDKDPSVMNAALCALHDAIKVDPRLYKNLLPSFASILKQVSEHRLPKSFDYHRYPAPFIQIKLLKVMALLGAGDRVASENMYAVIQQVMRRTDTNHTIGNAIIYECVRTATTIYPNPPLLAAAADAVAKLLRSTSHNLRYVGIDALSGIVKINPQHAHEHQLAVVNCLEDPDDTLKLKTLELLYKMTRTNNVEVIVERMMSYLRTTIDEHIRRDISRKVSELAERYAPSPTWFMTVISEVLELGGNHLEPALAHSLMKLIAEQDEDMHRSAVDIYTRLLDAPTTKMPDLLLQVIVWVMGEYGHLAAANPGPRAMTPSQVMSKLVNLLNRQKAGDLTRALLIPALGKLCVQGSCGLPPEAEAFVSVASRSSDVELQQRAYELQALLTAPQEVQGAVLPRNQASEAYSEDELAAVEELSFLTSFVNEALQNGSAPYIPPEERTSATLGGVPEPAASSKGGLRFEAYEPAFFSAGSPATSASRIVDPFSQVPPTRSPAVRGVQTGHSRSNSGSSSTVATGEPQLRGASRGGASKWGPAHFETSGARGAGGSSAAAAGSGGGVDLLSGLVEAATASTDPQQRQRQQQQPDLLMQLDDDEPPASAAPAPQPALPQPASVDMLLDVGPTLGPPPQQQPPAAPAAACNPAPPNMGLQGLSQAMLGGLPQPAAAFGAPTALPLQGPSWSPAQPLAHPPQQQQLGQYGMAGLGMGMGGGMRPPTQPAHTAVSRGGQSMVPSKQPQQSKANADPFSDLLG